MGKINLDFLIFGNNGESRFETYSKVLKDQAVTYCSFDYLDIIDGSKSIPEIEGSTIVRLFSPWYNARMVEHFNSIGDFQDFDYDIQRGDDFYSNTPKTTNGFASFLDWIDFLVRKKIEKPLYVNPPDEIKIGRNKNIMYKHFEEQRISHPKTFYDIKNLGELVRMGERTDAARLFIKMNSGSLGKGIAYLENGRLYSTVGITNGKFFSEKNIFEVINESDIEEIVRFLIGIGSVVQEGINLSKINERYFDFRHYLSHGNFLLTVLRTSDKKVTNTSLGGEIIWEKDIGTFLTAKQISTSKSLAGEVEKSLRSLDLAVDIGVESKSGKAYCLEVNFLPGRNIPEKMYAYEVQRNIERLKYKVSHS